MSSWAERVHRRAADISSVVTSCGHPGSSAPTYPYRLEKVKFGVPLEEVCKNDNIPGPLLVLILKLNKESPNRRDVFRAPGHQGAMKKLIHFLQAGRLVNVDNYSVYTIASVLKKFLRKVPQGVFGREGEKELFAIIELDNENEQTERLHNLFTSLPKYTQHLLVLLFGTFRVIASNAAHAGTGMTSEALGVSVAPSFFQSCVSDGKTARMEDVLKFKVATKIMKHIIDKFATQDIFGRENYEYYARVTGRILKVQDEWICSFQYPPPPRGKVAQQKYALQHSLEAEKTWLQCQCERWGLLAQEESRSTPALLTSSSSALDNSVVSLGVTPEHSFMESCARLSVSLEGPGLFAMTSSPLPSKRHVHDLAEDGGDDQHDDDDHDDDNDDDDDDDNDRKNYDIDDYDDDNSDGNMNGGDLDPTGSNKNTNDTNRSYYKENQENYQRNYNLVKSNVHNYERKTFKTESDSSDSARRINECDTDYLTRVGGKRRYRQNKKKLSNSASVQLRVQLQQQRRFRSNHPSDSKSLDSEHYVVKANKQNSPPSNKGLTESADAAFTSNKDSGDGAVAARIKSRLCSRCRRGLRHTSSCSSSTNTPSPSDSNVNPNGKTMTMEELRAVNRYAESTKSLSYLPQVHERQTARMRTRSEWFLGPKVVDLLYCSNVINMMPIAGSTCSNCCLQQRHQQEHRNHQDQKVQMNQQHELEPVSYLGGGSTRDIHVSLEAGNTSLFMYYNKQQREQRSQFGNRQSFHSALEHMDTDDEMVMSTTYSSANYNAHSKQQRQEQFRQQRDLQICDRGGRESTESPMLLDTNYVGNIRLSTSAESVQNAVRRPSTRRILLGANIPRQYPMRSSLRRHKEKQIGSTSNSSNCSSTFHKAVSNSNNTAAVIVTVSNTTNNNIAITTASIYHHQSEITTPVNQTLTDYNMVITSLQQQQRSQQLQQTDKHIKPSDVIIPVTLTGESIVTTFKAPRL